MKVKPKNAANLLFSSTSLEYVYFEAIANSIDAGASEVKIAIQISSFTEPETLRISILDNGKGFDEDNFNRFSNLLDRLDPQHKGIGRLVYLSYFSEIFVDSAFGMQRRHFIFNDEFDGDCSIDNLVEECYSTVIELTGYSKERIHKYDYISHVKLKHSILNHFLPRFYQLKMESRSLTITISVETDNPSSDHDFYAGSSRLSVDDLPELREKIVPDESDLLAKFRMLYSIERRISEPKSVISAICADNRTLPVKIISDGNTPNGFQMIFILYSDYFDGKTNATREAFTFDESVEKRIKRKFTALVAEVIKEEAPEIQEKNSEVYLGLQAQYPHLVGYFDEPAVGLMDKASVVQAAQYRFFTDQKEILEAEDLTDEQYEMSLGLSSRILTEYILYRAKIIQKLKNIRSTDHESEIHNLLVPKGRVFHANARINDIFLNNAWVLDDKYMSYTKVLSDTEIEKIYTELDAEGSHQYSERESGRPDITVVFSRDPEEANAVDVVIVELKKLGLDLAKKEEVVSQLQQRARRLLEFYPAKIQRIWFYGIIDFDDELLASLIEREYTPLFSEGTVYYKKQPISISLRPLVTKDADIFILSFEAMLSDAEIRNQTFLSLLKEGLKGNQSV
jgi:hypothetical protein